MATTPTTHPPAPPKPEAPDTVTVISHSNLFYWWPIWAVGFLMAILTYIDNHRMIVLPSDGVVFYDKDPEDKTAKALAAVANKEDGVIVVDRKDGDPAGARIYPKKADVVVVRPGTNIQQSNGGSTPTFTQPQDVIIPASDAKAATAEHAAPPKLHMSRSSKYGVVWAIFLLLVIVITNVPLRGLWSVVVIVSVLLLSVIFALLTINGRTVWDIIFEKLGFLDIRINAGGYIFISTILFGLWLLTLLVFDRNIYIVFTPGQFKVCTEIGGGERVFDAQGMKLEKQRSDLFRHWILGLGSGDLIVRTAGAANEHIDLPNVLFIGRTVARIEDMMKRKAVVAAH